MIRGLCPRREAAAIAQERWETGFLLLVIAAIDLFGGHMFNIALGRRTMDVFGPVNS
jgi:hypothetical protein